MPINLSSSREEVLKAVAEDGLALNDASEVFKNDKEVVITAIRSNRKAFLCASGKMQEDPDVFLAYLSTEDPDGGEQEYPEASDSTVKKDDLICRDEPDGSSSAVVRIDYIDLSPRSSVYVAGKRHQDGLAFRLRYASDALRNTSEINWAGGAYDDSYNSLPDDRAFVLARVSACGYKLGDASDALRNDKEVVKVAVGKNGSALQYASDALRNDKEVVKVAVGKNGSALQYASDALRNDKEVVKVAVGEDGWVLQYASAALRNDKEVVKVAVGEDGWALQYASAALRNDKEVVMVAVGKHGWALQYASAALRNDKEVVMVAVGKNGSALQYASDALRNDKEVVMVAVGQNGSALQYASAALRNDKEVVMVAVGQNGSALRYASYHLRNNWRVVLAAVGEYPIAIEHAPSIIQEGVKRYRKQDPTVTTKEALLGGRNYIRGAIYGTCCVAKKNSGPTAEPLPLLPPVAAVIISDFFASVTAAVPAACTSKIAHSTAKAALTRFVF